MNAEQQAAERVAGMLGGIRTAFKTARANAPHAAVAEVLLWIAAGYDHRSDLVKITGMNETEVKRVVCSLIGRGRRDHGRYVDSALQLVEARPHPHRRGEQLRLTAEAKALISSTFVPLA